VGAGGRDDALALVQEERPALVVLEVVLAGTSGYELCRELREQFGRALPIVFLSGTRTEPCDRVAGLLLGADDYIVKPFDPDELMVRVRRLISRSPGLSMDHGLTAREHDVLALLAEGLSQADIARRLFITPKTVGKHIEHIFVKLGVHTRAHAVSRALREQLIDVAA
jgi:DNA-binding NarL/FixJ family response regulator